MDKIWRVETARVSFLGAAGPRKEGKEGLSPCPPPLSPSSHLRSCSRHTHPTPLLLQSLSDIWGPGGIGGRVPSGATPMVCRRPSGCHRELDAPKRTTEETGRPLLPVIPKKWVSWGALWPRSQGRGGGSAFSTASIYRNVLMATEAEAKAGRWRG